MLRQFWKGRCDRCYSGDDGYGDGEHIVDQQRAGSSKPGRLPEVGPGDGIGTAAIRVGPAGLPVGGDYYGEKGACQVFCVRQVA